ncbi:transglycosylase SLT domain-containing protein [Acidiphilium sp. AL]|uniref:transglycosylase SLT domain-containing protein n=1 Tax=Acidiphilium sp. AL TaxID=2871704 RepID=UPI0021CAEABA|nr:transglycosylase SLT domain-containing protein [Acidiphilium sp. AL]MCU4162110.1 transglycosylase SLT domain-containing protein [Acidiphilium sp. AL]
MAGRRAKFHGDWLAAGLACLIGLRPAPVSAATLSDADFATLAARCAPGVPEWVLRGVARTESDFHPWMLHDNSTHASVSPASLAAAEAEAAAWVAEGHSVDLGLMQINAANLPALGMTIRAALDPYARRSILVRHWRAVRRCCGRLTALGRLMPGSRPPCSWRCRSTIPAHRSKGS